MTDQELLVEVKKGLSITSAFNDNTLLPKVIAVKQYMLNYAIPQNIIESGLGIVTLTIGVTDLWNLSPGVIEFSPAFNMFLTQLNAISLP